MSKFNPLFAATQARLLRRARTEAALDVATTVAATPGATDGDSGAHPNTPVPGQAARDAGKSAVNPTVRADRGPGEVAEAGRRPAKKAAKKAAKKEAKGKVAERTSTVGLFPGCTVKVIELSTGQTVERHAVVTKVDGREITVKGGDTYHQDQYQFLRIS